MQFWGSRRSSRNRHSIGVFELMHQYPHTYFLSEKSRDIAKRLRWLFIQNQGFRKIALLSEEGRMIAKQSSEGWFQSRQPAKLLAAKPQYFPPPPSHPTDSDPPTPPAPGSRHSDPS